MNDMTFREYQALLRQDFYAFVQKCFSELNPDETFSPNWHLEVLAAELDAVRQGKTRRLIVNQPPRGLKSLIISVALCAYWMGHNPSIKIICVSYSYELAEKFSRDCRRIMLTDWYQAMFPTRLSSEKNTLMEFETTAGGYRLATSVEGVLTGRGADVILIDDPAKPADVFSEVRRKAINDWYSHTLVSRLNDKQFGQIVILMQRLHEDDLVGHVMAWGQWKLLSFPAIAHQEEEFSIDAWYGKRRYTRHTGDILHPAREPLEVLNHLKESLGEYNFAAQYLLAPAPLEGGVIKRNSFKTYTPGEEPGNPDYYLQSWDTANKFSELANHSVCTTWAVKNGYAWLLHVLRLKLGYAALKNTIIEHACLWHSPVVLIEDKASGMSLIDDLMHTSSCSVERYEPKGDKIMRFVEQTGFIESGHVLLPSEAPWREDYLKELTLFPNGKFDDQVDATSQALDWIRKREYGPGMGILNYGDCKRFGTESRLVPWVSKALRS